jgi:hypothetical protein
MKFMDAASDFEALMMLDDVTTEADKFFSDSDCSFYEIESHSPLMFKTTGKEASSILQNLDEPEHGYSAWIGSKSLHLA